MSNWSVFMSYSRHDAALVGPLTQLLRITGGAVFRDLDSIQPGTKWRVAISSAIDSCETFLLFWCAHSLRSQEIRAEYEQAIALSRPVIPVLLDRSELPEELAEYQTIDLSIALGDHLTPMQGMKGREAGYVLREPSTWEIEQAQEELVKGLASVVRREPDA